MPARIYDMSRFRPPDHRDEPPVITVCEECGDDIYEYDEVCEYADVVFCSETCAIDAAGMRLRVITKEGLE